MQQEYAEQNNLVLRVNPKDGLMEFQIYDLSSDAIVSTVDLAMYRAVRIASAIYEALPEEHRRVFDAGRTPQ